MAEQQQNDEQEEQTEKEDDAEYSEIQERKSPSGRIVYKAVCREGADELERPSYSLAWSGLAAGMSMGFSMATEGLLKAHLPQTTWAPLLIKLGYSMGFIIVVLGRQQLFTENTLTVILPLAARKDMRTFCNVMRLWSVVLATNILGALLFASAVAHFDVFRPDVNHAFLELGRASIGASFGTMVIRSVFAGWLIAMMVWLLPFAETFRVVVIMLLTYVIAVGDFGHVVAGSVDTLYLVCRGELSVGGWFTHFFLPVLVGNILGGVPLVALINHAQVVAHGRGTDA